VEHGRRAGFLRLVGRDGLYLGGMSDSSGRVAGARTLSEAERAELVRLILGGRWRVLGSAQGAFVEPPA
jgi:hypothetical protein